MRKLLLTAFEPFGGESINPSLEVARQFENLNFSRALVQIAELPVDRHRAIDLAFELMRASRPDVMIMSAKRVGDTESIPSALRSTSTTFAFLIMSGINQRTNPS